MFLYSLYSCDSSDKNEETLNRIIQNCLGKEIQIPKKIQSYEPLYDYKTDSLSMFNADLKIFSHINVSCPPCINDIILWDKLSRELQFNNVPVILFCTSKDSFEVIQYLFETESVYQFPYPLFFDFNNYYVDKNRFMSYSDHFETVLVDKRNKILLLGNPLLSKDIKKMYSDTIKKYSSSFVL